MSDMNPRNVPPSGYHVEVVYPDTGRVITPNVLSNVSGPSFNPGPNQKPEVTIPVKKDEKWLSDRFDDDPEMRVWIDGERLPIDVLRDAELEDGAAVLNGVGGVELEHRVTEEFDDVRRHTAADDLITSATSYSSDTPEPDVDSDSTVVQSASTTAQFNSVSEFDDTEPVIISDGKVMPARTGYVKDGTDRDSGSASPGTNPDATGGTYLVFSASDDDATFNFDLEYTIPSEYVEINIRFGETDSSLETEFFLSVNGTSYSLGTLPDDVFFSSFFWDDVADDDLFDGVYSGPDISPGDEVFLEIDGGISGDVTYIDVVSITDARYDREFPNELHEDEGHLDGPAEYTETQLEFNNNRSAFSVVGASIDSSITDVSGSQRLQVSNDGGETYVPTDGSEQNTETVSVEFDDPGSGSQARFTLDGISPSGARDATPRFNYDTQEIESFELTANIDRELLLVEQRFDDDLESVLTRIGDEANRIWAYKIEDGDPTVTFIKEGQRVSDERIDLVTRSRSKRSKTYESVTVKGSNQPVSNEIFTAEDSFTPLVRQNLITGSETVYDESSGENFDRGEDYEIRYSDGEIRATVSGDLEAGETYRIDYRYEAQGTYELPGSSDPVEDEFVAQFPGVTSSRLAEQIAFVVAGDFSDPRYTASVRIPEVPPTFDPTESLPAEQFSLPNSAGTFEPSSQPTITPIGLDITYGTRLDSEQTLSQVRNLVNRVTDRV